MGYIDRIYFYLKLWLTLCEADICKLQKLILMIDILILISWTKILAWTKVLYSLSQYGLSYAFVWYNTLSVDILLHGSSTSVGCIIRYTDNWVYSQNNRMVCNTWKYLLLSVSLCLCPQCANFMIKVVCIGRPLHCREIIHKDILITHDTS